MTKIVNFNDLRTPTKLTLDIDGKMHDMVAATVQSFIDSATAVQDLGLKPDPVKEAEAYVSMIKSAFPTLTEKEILGWEISQIHALIDIIRNIDGQDVSVEEGSEGSEGNDIKAN